ncbi:MAG: dodecin family protein, partial [Desulfobulbales bacterium]|nr:dodecin family protein [Desulfobulbales bacterium]
AREYRFVRMKRQRQGGEKMASVAKIVELSADSEKSFEDAMETGITRATRTIKNIKSVWVKDQEVLIEDNRIKTYRVHMKVTFKLE